MQRNDPGRISLSRGVSDNIDKCDLRMTDCGYYEAPVEIVTPHLIKGTDCSDYKTATIVPETVRRHKKIVVMKYYRSMGEGFAIRTRAPSVSCTNQGLELQCSGTAVVV